MNRHIIYSCTIFGFALNIEMNVQCESQDSSLILAAQRQCDDDDICNRDYVVCPFSF